MPGSTRQKPIGVKVRRPGSSRSEDEWDIHYFGRDEVVLVVKDSQVPDQHFQVDRSRWSNPSYRTVRWSHSLMKGQVRGCFDWRRWGSTPPSSNEPSPLRGQEIGKYTLRRLEKLPAGTTILFKLKGVWTKGFVQEWVDPRAWKKTAKRAKAKEESKERSRRNRYERLPSAWERLLVDNEFPGIKG